MTNIPVRRMAFDFPADVDLVFIKDDPDLSYTFLGTWMMLPYLEPYLIRSIQGAMAKVTDPELREDMKRFCAQEGQHFKQHARANDMVRARNPGFAKLKALEEQLDAEFLGGFVGARFDRDEIGVALGFWEHRDDQF